VPTHAITNATTPTFRFQPLKKSRIWSPVSVGLGVSNLFDVKLMSFFLLHSLPFVPAVGDILFELFDFGS
jgi:hypothetical protein